MEHDAPTAAPPDKERRLMDEQAALRRVATLVARQSSSAEIFDAVTHEACHVLDSEAVGLLRFEADETATLVAQSDTPWEPVPLGTSFTLDGENVVTRVYRSQRASRADDWTHATGAVSAMAKVLGVRSAVATPVVVDGRVWGVIVAATSQDDPLPADTESRIEEFTALVATAIGNAEARDHVSRLAEEQAALRRIAVLVARGVRPEEVFEAVVEEVGRLLPVALSTIARYERDATLVSLASWSAPGAVAPVGLRWPLEGTNVAWKVFETGGPSRVDDYSEATDPIGVAARAGGVKSAVGAPIVVEGRLWGLISARSTDGPLPAGSEQRLSSFTELVATAISNAEARDALARLANEQMALRRVAVLVAEKPSPEEVFTAVTEAVGSVLEADMSSLLVYPGDGAVVVVAIWSRDGPTTPIGTSVPLDEGGVAERVFRSGAPARIDEYGDGPAAERMRAAGMRSSVAAPVFVEGRLWGMLGVAVGADNPLPEDAEERLAAFTELIATAVSNAEARGDAQRLTEEQAALRRVATLVADGVGPDGVFPAVASEVDALFGADVSAIVRFEDDGAAVVLGDVGGPHASGKRVTLDPGYVVDLVRQTQRSARFDTDDPTAVDMPSIVRAVGIRSAVASPVVVDGRLWGAVTAASVERRLPPNAELRLTEFTALLGTAVSNAQARGALQAAVDEQGALRRVATLVATGAAPPEVFSSVTREIAGVLGAEATILCRAEADGGAIVVGTWSVGSSSAPVVGTRLPRGGMNLTTMVLESGRSARLEDYGDASGRTGEIGQSHGLRSAVGAPIVVERRLWGLVVAGTSSGMQLPPDAEQRLAGFTELVATAVSNAEARRDVQRLAEEQAALRRVATLVAVGASQAEIFNAITEGVAGALGEELRLVRYEEADAVVVAASEGPHVDVLPLGTRLPIGGNNALSEVFRTGRPARIDDYSRADGPIAEAIRPGALRSAVAVPMAVEARTWGAMLVGTFGDEPLLEGTEDRLVQFAELMATSIANTESREALAALVDEQAALQRIATLVAQGASPERVFEAVANETAAIFQAITAVMRFERDPPTNVVVGVSSGTDIPVGTRWPLADGMTSTAVYRTGRSSRLGAADWASHTGPVAAAGARFGVTSQVACPIFVERELWGVITLNAGEELPADTEQRLEMFTELVTTAIANATARADLVASRARLVTAGDEARRRIERNLHDGTQQRLIALGLDLQRVRSELPAEQDGTKSALAHAEQDLEAILVDLRELSHGLHPPLLSRLGLGPSLQALARRSPIPVRLDLRLTERPAVPLETAVYYVVSEAVANAVKHSRASEVSVTIERGAAGDVHAAIVDDGVGGADASNGSGLTGLLDRVEALGGRLAIDSPAGGGTRISVGLPAEPPLGI
jgi:GAF domain-containing protein